MKVENWCTPTVVAAEVDVSASELAEMMRDHEVSQIVIVHQTGTGIIPLGLVTDRDLAAKAPAGRASNGNPIAAEIMSRELLTIFMHDDLDNALIEMRARGLHQAPVVNEAGAMIGILQFHDAATVASAPLFDVLTWGSVDNALSTGLVHPAGESTYSTVPPFLLSDNDGHEYFKAIDRIGS